MLAEPIIAVADPHQAATTCAGCFLAATQPILCDTCGITYCSRTCRDKHKVHSLTCGSHGVDAFCRDNSVNFPRVARDMLATSLTGDFVEYWAAVNALVSVPVSPDDDMLPKQWHIGYGCVRDALAAKMGGQVEEFFSTAFNLRTYARLMGTLRLNSFAIRCPITGPAHSPAPSEHSVPAAGTVPVVGAASAAGAGPESSSCTTSNSDGGGCGGGCGDSDPTSGTSGCASSVVEAKGGTALYGAPSLLNHSCDPCLDVVMGPSATLALQARREIAAGEELTISYLDCSLPVATRRAGLAKGYGFECNCPKCVTEAAIKA